MSDPALALQGAMNLALRAAVTGVAGRVHDRVPADVIFPYLEFGEFQTLSAGAQCLDGFEVFAPLHVWSRAVGQVELKTLAGSARTALHDVELALGPAWQFLEIAHRETRYLKDPDGLTSHAVMSFRALIAAA